jgi:hypothetical protein
MGLGIRTRIKIKGRGNREFSGSVGRNTRCTLSRCTIDDFYCRESINKFHLIKSLSDHKLRDLRSCKKGRGAILRLIVPCISDGIPMSRIRLSHVMLRAIRCRGLSYASC